MYIAPWRLKIQKCWDDRELNQARSKPNMVNRPVRTACTFVHNYSSIQYHSTESVFLIFPFLQTTIISQKWPSAGKGAGWGLQWRTNSQKLKQPPYNELWCDEKVYQLLKDLTADFLLNIALHYVTIVGWVIWPVKSSLQPAVMCQMGR